MNEDYDELLRNGAAHSAATQLRIEAERARLTFYGRPICNVLRPYFVERQQFAQAQRASQRVVGAIDRLTRVLCRDPALRARLMLTPRQSQLVELCLREEPEAVGRLDGFLSPEGDIRFVEYNPGVPGGMIFNDRLCEIFQRLQPLAALAEQHGLHHRQLAPMIVPAFMWAHEKSGGRGAPRVALIPPTRAEAAAAVASMTELQAVQALFERAGSELRVTPAHTLELNGGKLVSGAFEIDAAMVLDWTDFVAACDGDHPLWRAVREGAVWLPNSLTAFILRGHKSLFALLSDVELAGLFDAETNAALARHVPWTRVVTDTRTDLRGRSIELLAFIARSKSDLVLKPIFGFGGKGVIIGRDVDDASWSTAIQHALDEPYVVQERVHIPSDVFPCMVDGELRFEKRYVDFNPYVWRGSDVDGVLTRVSGSALLNMTAGTGSMVAPYFLP